MKKRLKMVLIVFVTLLFIIIGVRYSFDKSKDNYFIYEGVTHEIKYKSHNTISMMYETGLNTEEYVEGDSSVWPGDDYAFNSELSRCENGGNLSYNYQTKKITLLNNISDKCYVYFDVYNKAKIDNVTSNVNTNSITVSVSATAGENPISLYYYSINNGSYTSSSSNTHTFSNLSLGTNYSIRVYVTDTTGVQSNVYTINAETDATALLADYIKSLYTSQESNGLYYHTSSLANSAGDNSYRYAGANPNNYVCFGSDAATCPSDNLYRIIGVFGNQVKLIKADYTTTTMTGSEGDYYGAYSLSTSYYKGNMTTSNVASYYWNGSNGTSSTNPWSSSRLNTTNLNSLYLSYIGSTWSNKIATTSWKVGGGSSGYFIYATPQRAYNYEVGSNSSSTIYSAKIGLMYVSDYGYAASPSYWTEGFYNYSNSTLRSNNWMYMGMSEWTISFNPFLSDYAFIVVDAGNVYNYEFTNNYAVRPCFYLTSSTTYVSGSGTISDPIRIT